MAVESENVRLHLRLSVEAVRVGLEDASIGKELAHQVREEGYSDDSMTCWSCSLCDPADVTVKSFVYFYSVVVLVA